MPHRWSLLAHGELRNRVDTSLAAEGRGLALRRLLVPRRMPMANESSRDVENPHRPVTMKISGLHLAARAARCPIRGGQGPSPNDSKARQYCLYQTWPATRCGMPSSPMVGCSLVYVLRLNLIHGLDFRRRTCSVSLISSRRSRFICDHHRSPPASPPLLGPRRNPVEPEGEAPRRRPEDRPNNRQL